MARNRNREFSEGDGLNPLDLGAYAQDAEERVPVWARRAEEEENPPASEVKPEQEPEDVPLPEKPEDLPEAPAPDEPLAGDTPSETEAAPASEEEQETESDGVRERIIQTRAKKETEEDKFQEPQRVEGGAANWRNAPGAWQKKTDEPETSEKKGKKAGKKPPKKGKKGKKSKKKKTHEEERQSFLRLMMIILLCGGLFLMAAVMVVSNFVKLPILAVPQKIVTAVVSPIQSFFSNVTTGVADYLRMLKIRGNIEYEYEQLRIKLDDYATEVAMLDELRRKYEALQEQVNERTGNEELNPISAQVVGKVGNNYFSTLTLNVGSEDGVADYMAVVSAGGLVGVTYNVKPRQCDVRCIIDSDCTVAGIVKSSRDQGSVKGTLGTNGEPMCRMYYLPDNSLPRPNDEVVTSGVGMEFPRGIPIGYIRESTRGMEDNKSYVVVEPKVDFQHLEYVTVYRYRPPYAENAQERVSTSQSIRLETFVTARPIPGFNLENQSDFLFGSGTSQTSATQRPGDAATPAPQKTAMPRANSTPLPPVPEYMVPNAFGETPSPSPRPTFTPTPSPVPTSDPGAMTVEEDE